MARQVPFAFYGRVSTEDQQDPESSRSWQLHRARQLIEPHGGVVVAEYFDIGQSRSLPWKRRPEASRLLDDLAKRTRGYRAVVIGEPARAFYGGQFSLTFPVFTHYGVTLWVPEVGGPVDPGSEAHDMVMMLFGGMSKGERMRIKTRVRSAMTAQVATEGRFLGGRPPYGYRLADAGPHPNPSKAQMGARLHRLEPDPQTAPVVQRIFADYLSGFGYYAIAERLSEQDVPSPSGIDRKRNPHRHGLAWSKGAVRAILMNPRYTGFQVWNRQRRDEVLLDVHDVAAGHESVMRWNDKSEWVWSPSPTHEPLIDRETYDQVQALMRSGTRPLKTRKPSARARTYLLRGRVRCILCGRFMQGDIRRGHDVYYRCQYPAQYARSRALEHPKSVYVREDRLLPVVDSWLSSLFRSENIDATCAAIADAAEVDEGREADIVSARKVIADCKTKMHRFRALVEAGTDPVLVTEWIAETKAKQAMAEARLVELCRTEDRPTAAQIRELLEGLGGMVEVLKKATPELRAKFYEEAGLMITYDGEAGTIDMAIDLGLAGERGERRSLMRRLAALPVG